MKLYDLDTLTLIILEVCPRDVRVLRAYALIRDSIEFPLKLLGSANAHTALAESEVDNFIELSSFFKESVLTYDTDICSSVFNICRDIGRLGEDEPQSLLLVLENEFS